MAETDALELPVGLTEKQFLRQIARVEARLNKLAGDAPKKFVSANEGIARSFTRTTNSVSRSARHMRGDLQNVSFQLQDIFVQIAGGQGVTRALSQQLPQLLGGFGALGAGIGVAVAAFPTLIGFLRDAEEDSEGLSDQLSDMEKSFNSLAEAQKNASIPLDELIAKYGSLAEEMQKVFDVQFQTQLEATQEKASALQETLAGAVSLDQQQESVSAYEETVSAIGRALEQGIITQEEYNSRVAELASEMEPTTSLVDEYLAAVQRLEDAGSIQEQVAAWNAINEFIDQNAEALERNGVVVNDLRGQVAEMAEVLGNAAVEAGEVAANAEAIDFNRAISGASALEGGLITLNGLAQSLLSKLGGVINTAKAVKAIQDSTGDFTPNLTRFSGPPPDLRSPEVDPAIASGPLSERPTRRPFSVSERAIYGPETTSRGGRRGSGGGGSSNRAERPFFGDIEKDLVNLQRQIELVGKSNEEVATARARWELLDEAKKRGIPVTEELQARIDAESQSIGRLTGELERAEIAQQQFDEAVDGIADAMAGALVAGESLRDGLAQVFKQIASDILNSGIHSLLTNLIPGVGGGGDLLSGALRAAGLPARASGGPVTAGQAYWTGEQGPEPFVPAVNGRILSVSQAQAALRGGAGSPRITINNNAPGAHVMTEYATKDEVRILVMEQGRAMTNMMNQKTGSRKRH